MASGIVYSAVVRSPVTLASYQRTGGDFETIAKDFFPNIPKERDTKACFVSGLYTYHILVHDLIIYICAAETGFGKTIPFAFLNKIKSRFTNGSLAVRALTASEHEFDQEFSYILKDQMLKFTADAPIHKFYKAEEQVEEVMSVMYKNIEKIEERGQKLQSLLDKMNALETTSSHFQNKAKMVRQKKFWENFWLWIILIGIFAAVFRKWIILIGIALIVLMATDIIPIRSKSN